MRTIEWNVSQIRTLAAYAEAHPQSARDVIEGRAPAAGDIPGHDVILEGKYNRHNVGAQYMPNALRVLQHWTRVQNVCLILWSSSHEDATAAVLAGLKTHGVRFDYVNENPECPSTELCDFRQKFYFNILLDDKAGFDGATDWFLIEAELRRIGQWSEPVGSTDAVAA